MMRTNLVGLSAALALLAGCPYEYPGDVGDATDAPVVDGVDAPEIDAPDAGPDAPDIDAPGVVQWARRFGGVGNDSISDIAVHTDGSVVVIGNFTDTVDFGGGGIAASSSSFTDVYVAKYDATGAHVWSRKIGGVQADQAGSVGIDSVGDVYLTGRFRASIDVDGTILTATGSPDGFFIKLSGVNGTRLAAQRFGGGALQSVVSATQPSGATAIAVSFTGTIDFGNGPMTAQSGGDDIAVARYSSAGMVVGSRSFGGTSQDTASAITFSGPDVVVGGSFRGTANFGGSALTAQGAGDAFLAKYDTSVNHIWSYRHGGADVMYGDSIVDIAADASAIYVAGQFAGTATFGGGNLNSIGREDGVFARYETGTGLHSWSRSIGGSFIDLGTRVVIVGTEVWVIGEYSNTASLSGGGSVTSSGLQDVFLVRATSATGSPISMATYGGPGNDTARGLWVTPTVLSLAGTTHMGGFTLFGTELAVPGSNQNDVFVGQATR